MEKPQTFEEWWASRFTNTATNEGMEFARTVWDAREPEIAAVKERDALLKALKEVRHIAGHEPTIDATLVKIQRVATPAIDAAEAQS